MGEYPRLLVGLLEGPPERRQDAKGRDWSAYMLLGPTDSVGAYLVAFQSPPIEVTAGNILAVRGEDLGRPAADRSASLFRGAKEDEQKAPFVFDLGRSKDEAMASLDALPLEPPERESAREMIANLPKAVADPDPDLGDGCDAPSEEGAEPDPEPHKDRSEPGGEVEARSEWPSAPTKPKRRARSEIETEERQHQEAPSSEKPHREGVSNE